MKEAMELIKADFMKFQWSIPEMSKLDWELKEGECFAYEGICKLGVIDDYKCGIMIRIEGWLKGLGVKYIINLKIEGCLMHTTGKCFGQLIFNFSQ